MGRGVGGSTLINGMVWNRGNQQSFNSWADMGNDGWAWADLLPYFIRVCRQTGRVLKTDLHSPKPSPQKYIQTNRSRQSSSTQLLTAHQALSKFHIPIISGTNPVSERV